MFSPVIIGSIMTNPLLMERNPFEANPGMFAGPEAVPAVGEAGRLAKLNTLFHYGFNSEQWRTTSEQIAAVGFPVENLKTVARHINRTGTESENVLGSWTPGGPLEGQFAVYDLIDRVVPEKRLGTIAHESMHANTPFASKNAKLYGQGDQGEINRMEAAELAIFVTDQSIATGIHLNGYHKYLMEQEAKGEITKALLAEETSAIMAEMALTHRGGLEIVQDQQRREIEDMNRIKILNGEEPLSFTEIISSDSVDGQPVEPVGVDRTLVNILQGVENQADLLSHIATLKERFYTPRPELPSPAESTWTHQPRSAADALIAMITAGYNR